MIRPTLLAVGLFAHLSAAETLFVPSQYTTVQEAVSASSPNDVIEIASGHQEFPSRPIELNHHVTIRGQSDTSRVQFWSPDTEFSKIFGGTDLEVTCQNLEFRNYHSGVGDVKVGTFLNCSFLDHGNDRSCFNVECGDNIVVRNSRFINCERGNGAGVLEVDQGSESCGQNNYASVLFDNCDFTNCSSFTNGSGSGGAIGIKGKSVSLDIQNCHFDTCHSNGSGGAISIYEAVEGDVTIANCEFSNCTSFLAGGAIYCRGLTLQLSESVFRNNSSVSTEIQFGGGAAWIYASPSVITGCDFYNNATGSIGGGIHYFGPDFNQGTVGLDITACHFEQNTAAIAGGLAGGAHVSYSTFCENSQPALSPQTITGEEVLFSACGSCCIGSSCISVDESNCISAGGTYVDADCSVNACPSPEGSCCLSSSCVTANINTCFELGGSFAGFGTNCSDTQCTFACEGDVSGNGTVDFTDLLILINNWGNCPG